MSEESGLSINYFLRYRARLYTSQFHATHLHSGLTLNFINIAVSVNTRLGIFLLRTIANYLTGSWWRHTIATLTALRFRYNDMWNMFKLHSQLRVSRQTFIICFQVASLPGDGIASGISDSAYVTYCAPLIHRTAAFANNFDSNQGSFWVCCHMFNSNPLVPSMIAARKHQSSLIAKLNLFDANRARNIRVSSRH